jgi:hypothetical protein
VTRRGRGGRRSLAAFVPVAATVLVTWVVAGASVLAASPSPGAGAGDPRSSGQGPGLVGDPVFAIVAVVAIGLGAVVVTLAWVRLTARRGS